MTVKRKKIAGIAIHQDEIPPVKTPGMKAKVIQCIQIRLGEDEPEIIINHDDPEEELRAAKEILGNLRSRNKTISSPKPAPTSSSNCITLSELVEEYTEDQLAEDIWSEKTAHEHGTVYHLLIDITGDTPVDEVGYEQARDFKSTIKKLPANRNKIPLYRNKSIQQLLSMKIKKPMATATVKKYITRCSSLFHWAVNHGHTDLNPFFRMGGKKSKQKQNQERLHFDGTDLDKIFQPRPKYLHPYYYWLPLLGYYTGCRIEELYQLRAADIKQVKGTWVFDINESDDYKKLKTNASTRLIPVHSHLIELGFLDFIQKPNRVMVFSELKRRRDGHSQDASKRFSYYIRLESVGITHKKKSFHSFRHTVSHILKNAEVETKMIIAILGHADRDISTGRYGGDYDPSVLSKAIEVIPRLNNIIPYSKI